MVQAAEEVNRLKPLWTEILSVMLCWKRLKPNCKPKRLWKHCRKHRLRNYIFPVNVIGSLPFKEGSLVNPNVEMPLTTVSDTRNVHAYFTMNENNYSPLIKHLKE
jgi:membrane fusion protein (multidrug efflux system)